MILKNFESKLHNKNMQEKMSVSFGMVIKLMIACLISDPEIVESRLALADTCFDKMKQELIDLGSTSFADRSVFDAMDGDIEVIETLVVQFRDFSRQNDIENAFIVYSQQMLSYFADISANITTIEEVEAENAAAMYKASQITKYICIIILVIAGILSILLGRNVSAILSKTLNRSTSELQSASSLYVSKIRSVYFSSESFFPRYCISLSFIFCTSCFDFRHEMQETIV